jgi:hypothetical protein
MLLTARRDSQPPEHACEVVSGHGLRRSGEVALKILALTADVMQAKHRNVFALNLCA